MISKHLVRSLLAVQEKVEFYIRSVEQDSPNYDEAVSLSCISAAIDDYLDNFVYSHNV